MPDTGILYDASEAPVRILPDGVLEFISQPSVAGILIVLVIGAGFFLLFSHRRRALATLAASMGIPFTETGPEISFIERTGLPLFNTGSRHKTYNLMEMRGGGSVPDMRFFDYEYDAGYPHDERDHYKKRNIHQVTVALFSYETLKIPAFQLKPESLLDKVGEFSGFKGEDIDIPAFPGFSRKYRLTGPEKPEVLAFFNPNTVAYFEQHPGWYVEGFVRHLLLHKGVKMFPLRPSAYRNFMDEAKNLIFSVVKQV
ncbi:MAG: hypothetical protein A2X28_11515 [Elusimicrobia bacterium GWA2_56_46]|nr:MAG: hypothetical protein A2X28_11515 [Elusimicrobia bacterium GWA2_56_46]OGR54562.1 MAG: hypothetical protein A2X39_10300 [Elusimicrobia bacterium GWC2_56_31]HBB67229.1 hypothetical protein [Elusimicrobiota bacterium]HBW23266.1 hypothetical protein [Elusimicrobiota bacterium]